MTRQPNFLIVVADDLGFSDTGPYGSEIETPCLDRLASEGLVLTGFHTAPACSPTRAMLLSGTDNHIAGLGQMAEFMARRPEYKGKPGYEGYLNFRVACAAEILQDAGYHTMISGKWHLGLKKELSPSARGFAKDFTYLAGCGNHFNNEPQLDDGAFQMPAVKSDGLWMENGEMLDRKKDLPKDFYSTEVFSDKMIEQLSEHKNDPTTKDKPFFAYLAYTAPHWPLQAPRASIEKYNGRYNQGPEALRDARIKGLVERGLVPADVVPAPMMGYEKTEWPDKTEADKTLSARRMETYAAMVDLLDSNLGRVIEHLEKLGELDNTFVLFMSDNGAEGKFLEALPIIGATPLEKVVEKYYDNSLANIGNADSFVWYGARWAAAATAPSKGFKTYTFEGGIRCPCIVRYPRLQRATSSSGSAQVSHQFTTCMDILPTMLDLAGIEHPGSGKFRGRDVVPMRGASWVPYLQGTTEAVHSDEDSFTGWELFGRRAVRRGNWKAVFVPAPMGPDEWELYDLSSDLGETNNLANEHSHVLFGLLEDWGRYVQETGLYDAGLKVCPSPNA
ncbi:putative arylsulfatase [Microdochium trichocladiopsis]|uniref:Arylsulfatase n=1 Tax=Microdochium trichocladiopsis TaxID=1682393 RepID=A0A9P9BKH9_9PEZI|nr:putative arylsulfatase [Microdochium trichocladiopsis]KAH7026649.1 putative arylsulfatase [Microdochium trichocladiopsis]